MSLTLRVSVQKKLDVCHFYKWESDKTIVENLLFDPPPSFVILRWLHDTHIMLCVCVCEAATANFSRYFVRALTTFRHVRRSMG